MHRGGGLTAIPRLGAVQHVTGVGVNIKAARAVRQQSRQELGHHLVELVQRFARLQPFVELRQQAGFAIELLALQRSREEHLYRARHFPDLVGALGATNRNIESSLGELQHRTFHAEQGREQRTLHQHYAASQRKRCERCQRK